MMHKTESGVDVGDQFEPRGGLSGEIHLLREKKVQALLETWRQDASRGEVLGVNYKKRLSVYQELKNLGVQELPEDLLQQELDYLKNLDIKNLEAGQDRFFIFLSLMAEMGYATEVMDKLADYNFVCRDLNYYHIESLLKILIAKGESCRVVDKLLVMEINSEENLRIFLTICENILAADDGESKRVARKLLEFDIKSIDQPWNFCRLLYFLMDTGFFEEAAAKVVANGLSREDLLNKDYFAVLSRLAENGQKEKIGPLFEPIIMEKSIVPEDLAMIDDVFLILYRIKRLGQEEKVKKIVERLLEQFEKEHSLGVDVRGYDQFWFLSRIRDLGFADRVKEIAIDILDKDLPDGLHEDDLQDRDYGINYLFRLSSLGSGEKLKELSEKFMLEIEEGKKKIDLSSGENNIYLHNLANLGHARRVADFVAQHTFTLKDLTNIRVYEILSSLIKLGQSERLKPIFVILMEEFLKQEETAREGEFVSGKNELFGLLPDEEMEILLARRIQRSGGAEELRTNLQKKKESLVGECLAVKDDGLSEKSVDKFLQGLSIPELSFFKLALGRYGSYLHPKVEEIIKNWQGGDSFIFEIRKIGSSLRVASYKNMESGEREFMFLHRMEGQRARNWSRAAELGIPVAPITEKPTSDLSTNKTRTVIASRYCGMTVNDLNSLCRGEGVLKDLYEYIRAQTHSVNHSLTSRGIYHNDAHMNNFTVEFIDREYLIEQKKKGFNIDNLPFDKEKISFSPLDYVNAPERWQVVVRAIDFDISEGEV